MIVKVIFGQRKENYEGEYAPEALECMDEYGYCENPSWLEEKLNEFLEDKSFTSIKIIDIKVDQNKIRDILVENPSVIGIIKEAINYSDITEDTIEYALQGLSDRGYSQNTLNSIRKKLQE